MGAWFETKMIVDWFYSYRGSGAYIGSGPRP